MEKNTKKKRDFEASALSRPWEGPPRAPPGWERLRAGLGQEPCWGGARGKRQLGKHIEGLKAVIPLCNRGYSAKLIEGKSVTRAVA